MAYIKGADRMETCFLCDLPAQDGANDETNLILARGEQTFVIMNKYPYNAGHLVVAAYRHVGKYEDVSLAEHTEIALHTQRCIRALNEAYGPEGFNLGVNQGRAAGAGVPDHLHHHIVPRWSGDTNYMTTTGNTKVLPETLEETYAKLRPLLAL